MYFLGNSSSQLIWVEKEEGVFVPQEQRPSPPKLPAGVYSITHDYMNGSLVYIIKPVHSEGDVLVEELQEEGKLVMDTIRGFCDSKEKVKNWGFVFKRGVLLYGRPGTGKSCIIRNVAKYVIEQDGIVFIIDNASQVETYKGFLTTQFRRLEPDRLTLVVYEDIDTLIHDARAESMVTGILDSIASGGSVINLATTNYTEDLPERLVNRPGRFDDKVEVKMPNAQTRERYIKSKVPEGQYGDISLEQWVEATDDCSVADIAELIKSVYFLGMTLDTALEKLRASVPASKHFSGKEHGIGFNNHREEPSPIGFTNKRKKD